jgi:aldose 1-epimerase
MKREIFGQMPGGEIVYILELTNKNGLKVSLSNFGATITAIKIPQKNAEAIDIVLGFDHLNDYLASFLLPYPPYFGATMGRFSGRINKGVFELNGNKIQLNQNHNTHFIHGGKISFSQVIWDIDSISNNGEPSVCLKYISKHNEENFPGELTVTLQFILSERNELILQYQAVTTHDTVINLTNHSYFNLDGHAGNVTDQQLFIHSNAIVETTNDNIPTGAFIAVKDSIFDFNTEKNCPEKIDTSFVLERNRDLKATLTSTKNNLKMSVFTDQPSLHVYVGGHCPNVMGKNHVAYHALSGICFEAQNYPDAPNHPHFPSATLLAGEIYRQTTIFQFEYL